MTHKQRKLPAMLLIIASLAACAGCVALPLEDEKPTEIVIVSKSVGENAADEACLALFFDGSQYRLERYIPGNRFVRTYDPEGKLLLNQRFLGEKLQSQTAYSYDADGKLVKTDGFGYDEVYTTYHTEYVYDDAGNLIQKNAYVNEELQFEYHYDNNGRLVEGYGHIAGVNHTVYTYDADGKLLYSETQRDGELSGGWQYTYDESGRLVREDQFRISNGKRIELTNSYVYDEQGRCVRYNLGGFQGEQSYEEYTYDAAGNMLSSAYHHYTGDVSTYRWTYDEQGRMLSMQNEDHWYVGCSWRYDQQGNVAAMTSQGEETIFCYTWPEALPAWLQDEIAAQITGLTKLEVYTPEVYTRLSNFEERNT